MSLLRTAILLFIFAIVLTGTFSTTGCDFNPHRHGEWLFKTQCANCHMEDGTGLRNLIPTLHGSAYLTEHTIYQAGCLIRYGIKRPDPLDPDVEIYPMPPMPELSETEIINILNYIGNNFGNDAGYVNPVKLKKELEECPNKRDREW